MKTVLSFIDWYLPGYRAGGTLKAFSNQVSHFNNNYQFKIITRNNDYMETEPYDNVESNKWNKTGKNTEVFYASAKNINFGFLNTLVSETEFDTVYIHGVYSLWFSILPIFWAKKFKAKKIVISAHGMLGAHAFSVKSNKKKLFVAATKLMGLYKNVFFHAANEAEANDVKNAIGKNANIIVAEEMPMNMVLDDWEPREKKLGELKMVSVARIAPEKNTLYALESLKHCNKGQIIYDMYGPVYEEEYWKKCQEVITDLPSNVKVNYKGSIPGDEVLDMLKNCHLMYLPTTGENFGHTILESFMASTPVLISDQTPWKELDNKNIGWELPLENKKAFAEKIMALANSEQSEFNSMSKSALSFADDFIHDDSIKIQNDKLFNYE